MASLSYEGYLRQTNEWGEVRTAALQMAAHVAKRGGTEHLRALLVRHIVDSDHETYAGIPDTWGFSCRTTKAKFFAITAYYDYP